MPVTSRYDPTSDPTGTHPISTPMSFRLSESADYATKRHNNHRFLAFIVPVKVVTGFELANCGRGIELGRFRVFQDPSLTHD
jgi:hypothetical protein